MRAANDSGEHPLHLARDPAILEMLVAPLPRPLQSNIIDAHHDWRRVDVDTICVPCVNRQREFRAFISDQAPLCIPCATQRKFSLQRNTPSSHVYNFYRIALASPHM